MKLIYESPHFLVIVPAFPLVDRADGGHVVIEPRQFVSKRQHLSPVMAIELMRLTLLVGEAMETVMNKQGVDIGRVNYQDNGNWSVFSDKGPCLHYHLYGRARSAVLQPYGEALHFPHKDKYPEFYAAVQPLTDEDAGEIAAAILNLLKSEQYQDHSWGIPTEQHRENIG